MMSSSSSSGAVKIWHASSIEIGSFCSERAASSFHVAARFFSVIMLILRSKVRFVVVGITSITFDRRCHKARPSRNWSPAALDAIASSSFTPRDHFVRVSVLGQVGRFVSVDAIAYPVAHASFAGRGAVLKSGKSSRWHPFPLIMEMGTDRSCDGSHPKMNC